MAVATDAGSKKRKYIYGGLFFGGVIAVCVLLVYHWEYLIRFQQYGYLGLFIMTIVTGFSIPLPVPYMVLTFTLGGILHPALVGAVAGMGLGIGGWLLYLTGRGGRVFKEDKDTQDDGVRAPQGHHGGLCALGGA